MDRTSRMDFAAAPDRRSISSLESMTDSAHSNLNGGSKPLHARSVSSQPSYMKHAPIARKPVPSKSSPASRESSGTMPIQTITPPEIRGTLLLAIAASPHESTLFYLQSMLKKRSYGQIYILGNADQELNLKQLKVDIYSLLGRLGQEVKVQADLRSSWEETDIYTAVSKAVDEGHTIHGVLCSPDYDDHHPDGMDIMSLQQIQLEQPFKSSVSFLHSISKYAIPNFRSTGHEYKQPGLLLVTSPTHQSPTSTLYRAACRALLTLLVEANGGMNITIDYAENVLLPEPEPMKVNGGTKLPALNTTTSVEADDYPPPDSPTKLWALYNELGAAD